MKHICCIDLKWRLYFRADLKLFLSLFKILILTFLHPSYAEMKRSQRWNKSLCLSLYRLEGGKKHYLRSEVDEETNNEAKLTCLLHLDRGHPPILQSLYSTSERETKCVVKYFIEIVNIHSITFNSLVTLHFCICKTFGIRNILFGCLRFSDSIHQKVENWEV